MSDFSWLAGGGTVGLGALLAILGRLALDWLKERRTGGAESTSSAVTDQATANAVVLATLKSLSEENGRLQAKVKHLEDESSAKDDKITKLQTTLATTQGALSKAQVQIEEILRELANLKSSST